MPAPTPRPAQPETPPTATERRMLAGIGVFFAVALLAVAWALTTQVVTQYRMVCDRAAAVCALTRHHLAGSEESYQVPVPAGARAEVRVTPWRTKAPSRTYLELVAAEERIVGQVGVEGRLELSCEIAPGDAPQDLPAFGGDARVPGPAPAAPTFA